MLKVVACVVLVLGVVVVSAQDNYQFTDPNVQDIFRYARMAVGGGGVSKLKTLEMKGKSKVDLNGSLIDCAVDIKFLGPDYYLRIDSTATDSKLAGYASKNVLNAIRSGDNLSLPPENLSSAILKNERARVARLMLGAATYVSADVNPIFRSSGMTGGAIDPRVSAKTAATMEGHAEPNTADVSGNDGFRAHLVVSATDKMPVRISYPGASGEETMTFEDRRDAGGLKLPYRITTTAGGRVVDVLMFDEIRVNPEIGKGDFKR
jgi:hypothetical protein